MSDIPESDWKVFRSLHPIALGRYCERALADVVKAAMQPGVESHAKYLDVYKLIGERDQEIARAFNDFRRSTAMIQLMLIRSLGVITPEEMQQFSPPTRERIDSVVKG